MIITDRYKSWVNKTFSYKLSLIEGAIRSGKSVIADWAFALNIMACPVQHDALFLACAVSESMAQALIGENAGFGLRFIFGKGAIYKKYKDQNALFIKYDLDGKTYTRWVIFTGGSKSGCENSIRGLTIQGALIEEINLQTQDFFNEVLNRMAVSEKPFCLMTMNPSMSKHWVYRELIDSEIRGKDTDAMNYLHTTLVDNPVIDEAKIKEIEGTYDPTSVWYKGYILGERMNPAGAIYRIHEYNVITDFKVDDYDSYVVVCDQGETISATAITLGALRYDRQKGFYTYDVLKEYHHINSVRIEKHFEDYANDLADFVVESIKMMKTAPIEVIIDNDQEFYFQCQVAFQKKGLNPYIIKFPYKYEIALRVKSGVGFLHKGKLRFYKDCTETINDFKNAEYDAKQIEQKGQFVRAKTYTEGFGHLDMIDSVEYGFTRYLDILADEDIK